jgi:Mn2+/Fe2+ NRAMP family transporter
MKDKKVPVENLKYAKYDAFLGAFISDTFTFFMIVATAATLFTYKIQLETGTQAALAIRPFAGEFASFLFASGLMFAATIGMIIVPLTSAYAFTEFFGFEGSLDHPIQKSKIFYGIFLLTIIIAALLALTPFFPLFKIALYTQSLNGILLPVFFYFILKIINNKDLMGLHVNNKFYNLFAYGASFLIIFASTIAILSGLLGLQ